MIIIGSNQALNGLLLPILQKVIGFHPQTAKGTINEDALTYINPTSGHILFSTRIDTTKNGNKEIVFTQHSITIDTLGEIVYQYNEAYGKDQVIIII